MAEKYKTESRRYRYRSLFWPIILIGVGLTWLLGNLGVISAANIAGLVRMWPLLLILVGVDLLFGRSSPVIGGLIGVGAVVLLVGILLLGPSLGLVPDLDVQHGAYENPLAGAESAAIRLDGNVGQLVIQPVSDTNNLFEAEVAYVGEVEFNYSGELAREIQLRHLDNTNILNLDQQIISWFGGGETLLWEVGLSPDVPIDLVLNGGIGPSDLNLADLDLASLDIDGGIGEIRATLPAPRRSYSVTLDGGIGTLAITLPEDAAVRIEAQGGLGDVNVPAYLNELPGGDDNRISKDGVWESSNYNSAELRIDITINGGVGTLEIR